MKTKYPKIASSALVLIIASASALTQSVLAAEKTTATIAAPAVAQEQAPQLLVEQATKELFDAVKKHNAAEKKTEAYYSDVGIILDKVVDFPFIARIVMGKTGKATTPEQNEKFAIAFRGGLIKTYAKGIANYAKSTVKTLPSNAEAGAKRLSVEQEVTEKGDVHKLAYTMAQNAKTGEWKLINVMLNGVNLGDSFRSQFDQAMIKNANDVDKVIENWLIGS